MGREREREGSETVERASSKRKDNNKNVR